MSMRDAFKDLAGGGLEEFQPKPRPAAPPVQPAPVARAAAEAAPRPSPALLERVAAQAGFALNNHPVERKIMRSGRVGSHERAQPMTLRLRVADWNRFSAFCERNGYTVADGFARLAQLADES